MSTERKESWKSFLSTGLNVEMEELGSLLKISRKRQGRTQKVVSALLGVDPRVVAKIEKGSPEVSVGIYFQYLNILGLFKGWKVLFEPDLDIASLEEEVKRQRRLKRRINEIPDSVVDF
ncbi:MAG: helix-turn-helix domain-containing protein [Bacteriovoracaceae bacterium]|nr:helix-turn-helix domain-containing protein [Bacteriovoracaceae bacterium]